MEEFQGETTLLHSVIEFDLNFFDADREVRVNIRKEAFRLSAREVVVLSRSWKCLETLSHIIS